MKKSFCRTIQRAAVVLSLAAASVVCAAMGQEKPGTSRQYLADEPSITHHTAMVSGRSLAYTARAGYLSIVDEEQVVRGRMFYASYTLDQPASAAARPLLFAWNGGPGSNASLLELGALGPRRINKGPGRSDVLKPWGLVDNDDTWLQFADLVFVDPINTGYSYATTPEFLKEFTNDRGDADAMAEFIRLYRVHYELQRAPLFIAGESYGTYRAAGVADILAQRKIPLAGVILLSTLLDFQMGEDLRAVFLLPNYAATAFAQKRLGPELETDLGRTVDEAQRFAESEYLTALVAGDRISAEQKKVVAGKLARYTGIAAETWERGSLKLGPDQFAQEVLGPDKLEYVGHYDTTMVGKIGRKGEPYNVDADPSLDNGVDGVIQQYLRNDLGWVTDAYYAGPFGGRWPSPSSFRADWASQRWGREGGSPDRGPVLASALRRTPGLRVMIASGYFDLSTPFAAAEYSVSHLGLDPKTRARISFIRYAGGHAAYMDPRVRAKFSGDVRGFVTAAMGTSQ